MRPTTTPKAPITVRDLKRWAQTNARLASAVLAAQVFKESERARVDAYVEPIFQTYRIPLDPRWADDPAVRLRHCDEHGYIRKSDDLYLAAELDSGDVKAFYAEIQRAHRTHGYHGPEGHCPALAAEGLHRDACRALLESAGELFGWNVDDLHGDNRAKALDLLIGSCVQTGRVVNLFKTETRARA